MATTALLLKPVFEKHDPGAGYNVEGLASAVLAHVGELIDA